MKDEQLQPRFNEGTYAWFHFKLAGYELTDREGKQHTKLAVFYDNQKNIDELRRIVMFRSKNYTAVDKPGWKAGILVDR